MHLLFSLFQKFAEKKNPRVGFELRPHGAASQCVDLISLIISVCLLFQEHTKLMVRGYKWAEYHADIYDREDEKLRKVGLDAQCLGGGRIEHQPAKNYLKVQAGSE